MRRLFVFLIIGIIGCTTPKPKCIDGVQKVPGKKITNKRTPFWISN